MGITDNDKIIRVNMAGLSTLVEDFPKKWKLLGGRALSSNILLNECDPTCDPLGPGNVLVIAPGVLSGTTAPTSGRLSVGCKSPLTGGIKEANAGGNPGQDLMKLGYRAIIVKEQPADKEKRWGLVVNEEGISLKQADDYKGLWNYANCEKLLADAPKSASAISIGPAGEMMLKSASVACTDSDKERRPARHAARGGIGAVMGSKCLKWILVDPGKLPTRKPSDSKAFAVFHKSFSKDYLVTRHDKFKGTSAVIPVANMLNTFPYKNRTSGSNPEFEKLDGARIYESFEERGGEMHACMNGCIVKCSNAVNDKDGNHLTSALEFETLTLLGSNCAINDWEKVAVLDRLCDELGMDTIEIGGAIAVLMDAGGMEWGDAEAVTKLLREDIAGGTELGKTVGNGAVSVGKSKNHERVPAIKNQTVPAWDPRPLKATGVTYAISPMGADHTAGLVIDTQIGGEAAVAASQAAQINCAVIDTYGFCMFLRPSIDETRQFLSHFLGEEISNEQIADIGWQCLEEEWEFNEKAGLTDADDDIPACLREEGVGPDQLLMFDVPTDLIAKAKKRMPASEGFYKADGTG